VAKVERARAESIRTSLRVLDAISKPSRTLRTTNDDLGDDKIEQLPQARSSCYVGPLMLNAAYVQQLQIVTT